MISNFDAAARLMTRLEFGRLKLRQRIDLFFIDYDLIPILVQENYLTSMEKRNPIGGVSQYDSGYLLRMCEAAQAIGESDILSKQIRSHQEWGLLNNFGFLSSVYPCEKVSNNIGYPGFPAWLGKNSSTKKIKRMLRQLKVNMENQGIIGTTRFAVKFDYA